MAMASVTVVIPITSINSARVKPLLALTSRDVKNDFMIPPYLAIFVP
jgi:hypothetical protein